MEPSHIASHSKAEIERMAGATLHNAFPQGIYNIPIDIDLVAERHELIDSIMLLPELENKFQVAATLVSKPNNKCDIFLDANTDSRNRGRANFSAAHELGHVVLHKELFKDCFDAEQSIVLSRRINRSYRYLEREANHFAGAILIPYRTIFEDTRKIYEGILGGFAGDIGWGEIVPMLHSALANRYQVSVDTMVIRLNQLGISQHISVAILNKYDFIP